MTKEERAEAARCIETAETAIGSMAASLDRTLALGALGRLGEILNGAHAATSHGPKKRTGGGRRKAAGEPGGAGQAAAG